jgi:(1->4)-alpha-D-glucan 1-alpha-D-glucosylmutase
MLKAVKEAKVHASWIHPSPEYDEAIARFVAAILDRSEPPPRPPGRLRRLIGAIVPDAPSNPFLADFRPFQQRVAGVGVYNSLAQTLLKLVAPGVPDIYQGTEEWALTLVDPDNRRPVDYARLGEDLRALRATLAGPAPDRAALARSLLEAKEDGRIKLYVTHEALTYRRRHPALFAEGAYLPLGAHGPRSENVVAFGRALGDERVIAAVPRLLARLHPSDPPVGAAWAGTWLEVPDEGAAPAYRNVLTGEQVAITARDGRPGMALDAVFAIFPVALLEGIDER